MVAAVIFGLHFAAAVYAFSSRKKAGGMSDGLLAVAFFVIIFAVGWTISTMLTSLVVGPEGLARWLNRDALSLVVLTAGESVFYYFLLRSEKDEDAETKEKETT